jgi:NurA-like 5'-3' nuclease
LQGELGDIYYIAKSTRAPGYVLGGTYELFGIPITAAYIRLAKHANPLAIEIPSGDVDEEDVRHIMDVLSSRSVMGYPYALYLAHRTVSVSEALMDQLCVAAGLISFSKAREVLQP